MRILYDILDGFGRQVYRTHDVEDAVETASDVSLMCENGIAYIITDFSVSTFIEGELMEAVN